MGRPRSKINYTFEGGEADVQYARRADSEVWITTARKLRNMRILNGGPAQRRPGLARLAATENARQKAIQLSDGTRRMLVLIEDEVSIYDENGEVEDTLTGAPWVEGDLASLQFGIEIDKAIVTSHAFFPQVIAYDATAGTWSLADFDFDESIGGTIAQPYFRFPSTRGISLTVDSFSGATNLTASAALFTAAHEGARVRIFGREIEIDTVNSPTDADATIVEELYPVQRWTVASVTGFAVGEQVTTRDDTIDAEILSISAPYLYVMLTGGFEAPVTTDNHVVGPNSASALSAVASTSGMYPVTVQWDEAMISAARGYPGGTVYHKSRLYFFDFPKAPEYIAGSVVGFYQNFDLGDATDAQAFVEGIGDAPGKRIRHMTSAEQLIVLGEAGAYYLGDGVNSAITPTTIDFLQVGPEPVAGANPVSAAEGVLYLEDRASRMMLMQPTGTVRRSWSTIEISDLSPHLIVDPYRLLIADGSAIGPERYVMAINTDGTLAVMHWRRGAETVGWGLWETDGDFVDVELLGTRVWVIVHRDGDYTIERFDIDRLCDCSTVITVAEGDTPGHTTWADQEISLVWRDGALRAEVGLWTADASGDLLEAPTEARTYEGGRRFATWIGLWSPLDREAGVGEWQRAHQVAVDVQDAGLYYVDGSPKSPYRMSDALDECPPLRTGTRAWKRLGRRRDNEIDITQEESAPLTVRSVTVRAK